MKESVPICITGTDEHCTVHYRKYMNLVCNMFIDNPIWAALSLPEAFKIWRKRPETFFRNPVAEFRKRRKQTCRFSEVPVPATGYFPCLLSKNEPNNGHALAMGVLGPFDSHREFLFDSISSSIFSISLKDSSSERHSPCSNCLRDMAMAFASSAFSRHISISSHVFSKSLMPIMTLAARPLCVMTIGRCVRAVRSRQSLSVRRHSVKGTTSSSRRGRRIGCVAVRVMACCPQMEYASIVHYSAHNVNGALR